IEQVKADFFASGAERNPVFTYRPTQIDFARAKRRLFQIPVESVEDPTLSYLFCNQQQAIERMFLMLEDINTKRFLYGSLSLYGEPDDELAAISKDILRILPGKTGAQLSGQYVEGKDFAQLAEAEIAHYASIYKEVKSPVEVRSDLSAIMVSHGRLLIGSDTRVPIIRVEATLAHEVGVHLVTYWNGRAQPFRQLHVGLPGFEEVQEGVAVLAEYLAGGLTNNRLRTLAARVVAVDSMLKGASFVEVFRQLTRDYGLGEGVAFDNIVRAFRGGGMTRPAIYLRGLVWILDYLRNGGDLDLLTCGKIGAWHVPIIQELYKKKVLVPPPLRPRVFDHPEAQARLERIRIGCTILDLFR
ncbi:MAG: flavohemoglobin expression-modulating QEGLA motif protein, partial [Candidatus Obscuribacterales bacterium]|nr:flavohemoglobin expression-modulating QEGLA motif protein [Candidatus Obscuribacterales bacterium]